MCHTDVSLHEAIQMLLNRPAASGHVSGIRLREDPL